MHFVIAFLSIIRISHQCAPSRPRGSESVACVDGDCGSCPDNKICLPGEPATKHCKAGHTCMAPLKCGTTQICKACPDNNKNCPPSKWCGINMMCVQRPNCPTNQMCVNTGDSNNSTEECPMAGYRCANTVCIDEKDCVDCPNGQKCAIIDISKPDVTSPYCVQGKTCANVPCKESVETNCPKCPTDMVCVVPNDTTMVPDSAYCVKGKMCTSRCSNAQTCQKCSVGTPCKNSETNLCPDGSMCMNK